MLATTTAAQRNPITLDPDNEATWPPAMLAMLEDRFPTLRKHRAICEKKIYNVYEDPWPTRCACQDLYDLTVREIGTAVDGLFIVGYHSTRLATDEVQAILREGMGVTGAELVATKLARRVSCGDLTQQEADTLNSCSLAEQQGLCGEPFRRGQLWMVFGKLGLRDSGLDSLFSYWGGEALYFPHMYDAHMAPRLRSIGRACIAEVAVPISVLQTVATIGERILGVFFQHRGVGRADSDWWEGYSREPVPAPHVRRLVTESDPDFVRLTCRTGR
jgi:hypothetical protein